MDGVVEIITGRERRRRWSVEEKLRIVAETQETGARISAVAARHGLCESLVFTWRRQMREGLLAAPAVPSFVPVRALEGVATTTEPLHAGVTDMRRGMNGLALQVQQAFQRDPHAGDLYVFRGRRGKHTTFHIQFASVDDCLSVAPVVWADTAGLTTSARQRSDVHLHGRTSWPKPGIAELDVRSGLLRGHDAWYAPGQPGGPC